MRKWILAAGALALSLGMARAGGYGDFVIALSLQGTEDALAVQHYISALADPAFPANLRPVALYNRGLAYDRLSKRDLALADFTASLALKSDFDTYTVRAHVYERMGKPDAAVTDYTAAIATRPEIDAGYLDRGAYDLRIKRYQDALGDFGKIVQMDPKYAEVFFWRSTAYRLMGNYPAAMDDADQAIHLTYGKSPIGYTARSAIYVDQGDLTRAASAADDALYDNPHDVSLLLQDAGLQWELKDYDKALKLVDRAAVEGPTNGYVLLWRTIVRADASVSNPDLATGAAKVDLAKWPGPLVKLYIGQTDIDGVMREAKADPEAADARLCEADFYTAEWQRLHGQAGDVKSLLESAAADCPLNYIEKEFAASLLRLPA